MEKEVKLEQLKRVLAAFEVSLSAKRVEAPSALLLNTPTHTGGCR